jgi:hypothetical protein
MDVLASNFMKKDEWKKELTSLLHEPEFGTLFYDVFFELSPRSEHKFKNIRDQARVIVGAFKIIFDEKVDKELYKKMKKAHKIHHISNIEFLAMKKALIIVSIVYLNINKKYDKIDILKRGIETRFAELEDIVVADRIDDS